MLKTSPVFASQIHPLQRRGLKSEFCLEWTVGNAGLYNRHMLSYIKFKTRRISPDGFCIGNFMNLI